MTPPDRVSGVSLKFIEAQNFFHQKVTLKTSRWTDLQQGGHGLAFTVAGALQEDLLADLKSEVAKNIDGQTRDAFSKNFDKIVAKYGWAYKGGRNWRTGVIYNTNIATAYHAGRYAQMTDPEALAQMPYWRYRHSPSSKTPRADHVSWDGMVWRADDPCWHAIYPPNGWGCRCWIEPLSERGLRALRKDGPDPSPDLDWQPRTITTATGAQTILVPKGVDPGWAYNVGEAWQLVVARKSADIRPQALAGAIAERAAIDRVRAAGLADGVEHVEVIDRETGWVLDMARGREGTVEPSRPLPTVAGRLVVVHNHTNTTLASHQDIRSLTALPPASRLVVVAGDSSAAIALSQDGVTAARVGEMAEAATDAARPILLPLLRAGVGRADVAWLLTCVRLLALGDVGVIHATLTYGAKKALLIREASYIDRARAAATAAIKALSGIIAMADTPTEPGTGSRFQLITEPDGFDVREYRDFIAEAGTWEQTPQVKSSIAYCERSIAWLEANGCPEGWMDDLPVRADAPAPAPKG